MRIGMGIGWVQRWFAKPLDKGSIPSHASIFRPMYGQRWLSRGHRFQLGQALAEKVFARERGAFLAGFMQGGRFPRRVATDADAEIAALVDLLHHHRAERDRKATEASNLRDKLVLVSKELSALKREQRGDDK